jgi:GcrA cell cycle regulator
MSKRRGPTNQWDDEQIDYLRHLWEGLGLSGTVAADRMFERFGIKYTRSAIIGKIHRENFTTRLTTARKPSEYSRIKFCQQTPPPKSPKRRALPQYKALGDPPMSRRLTLNQLNELTCRWPIGDPANLDFRFCGRKCPRDCAYCLDHKQVAYVKPPKTRSRRGYNLRPISRARQH